MIYLGLKANDKATRISEYVASNSIRKVIVFSHEKSLFYMPVDVCGQQYYLGRDYDGTVHEQDDGIRVDYYTWSDIIMYRCFYPLLEEIDNNILIVCNELMRDLNRKCLTYNCLHHYLRQTSHRLAFSYLAYRSEPDNFMILLEQDNPDAYSMMRIDSIKLSELPLSGINRTPSLELINIDVDAATVADYERKRDDMFDSLGDKDPDTIPRQLHLWTGRFRKQAIDPSITYYARNARLNLPNVLSMSGILAPMPDAWLFDCPPSRPQFADFLRDVQPVALHMLTTTLSVDAHYANDTKSWLQGLEGFYAQAGIPAPQRA